MDEMIDNQEDLDRMRQKLAEDLDELTGNTKGIAKMASANGSMRNTEYKKYRSSMLSLSDMEIPTNYRDIFRWCRYYFKVDSLIGIAVRSMATFPVTEYVIQDAKAAEDDETLEVGEDSKSFDFYKHMLTKQRLTKMLQEIGYDYFLYGNCIIFAEPGVEKIKRRDENGKIYEDKQMTWRNIERLDLTRVRIIRDPETREKHYFYDIPLHIKKILKDKKPIEQYNKIPKLFKKAFEKKGLIRLNKDNIFHFSMPTESGDENLWATPPVLHALKLVMYTNVLRQAQEAIAYEHIIPRRVYYFQPTGDLNANIGHFTKYATDFAQQLTRQLTDPNFQIVSALPIQEIQHGGNGRNLLLVPEIEQNNKQILAAMGIPYEFIFGGMSYSGSTVSLRFLENQFTTYRQLLEEFMNDFLIRRLAEIRGDWETLDDDDKLVRVELADLKMQDDLQQKQLLQQMNQSGKISDEFMYEKGFGVDAEQMRKQLINEQKEMIKNQVTLALYEKQLREELAAQGISTAPPQDPNAVDPNAAQDQPQQEPNAQGVAPQAQAPAEAEQKFTTQDLMEAAQALAAMSPEEAEDKLRTLPQAVQVQLRPYYEQMKQDAPAAVDMRPQPEKLPPRRQGGI